MNQFKLSAIALASAQIAFMAGAAHAQTADTGSTATVVVTGQRASLQNAQKIKQDAENAKMSKLYRKEILGEEVAPSLPTGFVAGVKPAPSKAEVVNSIEETVAGD